MNVSDQSPLVTFSAPRDTGRYVILFHCQPGGKSRRYEKDESDQVIASRGGNHYDWMFESNTKLSTWATLDILNTKDAAEIGAVQLPDHRIEYLQYEGQVSGDRGTVGRVESGEFELLGSAPDRYTIVTRGIRAGLLVIYRTWCGEGVSFWRISFRPNADGKPTLADAS